ncbi:MAG: DUF2934 domain-containing protein [Pseudomonadota bacterium]
MVEKRSGTQGKTSSFLDFSNPEVFESIKKRAYELYCKRGQTPGNDMKDWLEAEKQVKRELRISR